MRILTAGGGSGGHVTPVVAVLRELASSHPQAEVRFWCDKKFEPQARSLMSNYDDDLIVQTVISGKLRRYNNIPMWQQLARVRSIVIPNIIDSFKILAGTAQCIVRLLFWRPDVIFTKGGYVCLPIGIAARILNIPLVIHDSDAHPGLTNIVLSRWASSILTGAPTEYYKYPSSITKYVGIPIDVSLKDDSMSNSELKSALGFASDKPLIVCTGGGLGARRLNMIIAENLSSLLEKSSVALVTGQANYEETMAVAKPHADNKDLLISAFISGNMNQYFAAADVVVTRAGMTTLLELAALAKPVIIIPNAYLTGDHQTKNAAVYHDARAAVVLREDEVEASSSILIDSVLRLIGDTSERKELSSAIKKLAKPDAARETAEVIVSVARSNSGS